MIQCHQISVFFSKFRNFPAKIWPHTSIFRNVSTSSTVFEFFFTWLCQIPVYFYKILVFFQRKIPIFSSQIMLCFLLTLIFLEKCQYVSASTGIFAQSTEIEHSKTLKYTVFEASEEYNQAWHFLFMQIENTYYIWN